MISQFVISFNTIAFSTFYKFDVVLLKMAKLGRYTLPK